MVEVLALMKGPCSFHVSGETLSKDLDVLLPDADLGGAEKTDLELKEKS